MKTTIELQDELAAEARAFAAKHRTTLRAVVEEGLRRVIRDDAAPRPFKLRDAAVNGHGLRREVADAGWDTIRALAYDDRGG